MFVKYPHLERLGSDDVEGILEGTVYVFPKIDGTNASVWMSGGKVMAGSRRRELSEGDDNAGFWAWVNSPDIYDKFEAFFAVHPGLRLYGEWLVPHTIKRYRPDAWNKFYVFDVLDRERGFLPWEWYSWLAEESRANPLYGVVEVIPPMMAVNNPTVDWLLPWLDKNKYLLPDTDPEPGEGLVLKQYGFINRFGRTTWAKIVRQEFKEKHSVVMGVPEATLYPLEWQLAQQYCTAGRVEKVFAKIAADGGWTSRRIPELLNRVWHDIITEETWDILKSRKNPKIDFAQFYRHVVAAIKALKPELF